jgi:hypothetical protein
MKTRFVMTFGLAALVAMLVVAKLSAQEANADRINVTWSDPSRPGLVKVNLMNGGISVKTHTGRDVIIELKSSRSNRRGRPPAEVEGLKRIEAVSTGLRVEEQNNVMNIGTNMFGGGCCSDLEIQVPARTNLELRTLNGGQISVDGVEGDLDVQNNNGAVVLTNVAGSVVAHSLNGKVTVSLREITVNKPMSFTSMNGNIDVTLPSTTKANFKMRTDHGDVWSDFEIQLRASEPRPNVEPRRPGVPLRIEIDRSVTGTVNGGGPDFDLRTMNGNIYIRKSK